jgi:long-chain fatty acid transport protein
MWTNYEDYTMTTTNYNSTGLSGTNVYSRTNKVFGVSVDYHF